MPKGYDIRTEKTVEAGIVRDTATGNGVQLVEYIPGNGTRYVILITPLSGFNEEEKGVLGVGTQTASYLITWVNRDCRSMKIGGLPNRFLFHGYVSEKLTTSIADGVVLAELLGHLLGIKHQTCEEFEES